MKRKNPRKFHRGPLARRNIRHRAPNPMRHPVVAGKPPKRGSAYTPNLRKRRLDLSLTDPDDFLS